MTDSDILARVENLRRDVVNLPMSLARFPAPNGNEAGLFLFKACWCGVEKT